MGDWLARAAATRPGHEAVVADDARWTHAQLDAEASRVAAGLAARGVRSGDHVAAALATSAWSVALVHACARLGAVLAPLDPRLPALELARRVRVAEARWAVAEPGREAALGEGGARCLAPASLQGSSLAPVPPRAWEGLQGLVFTSGTSGGARAVRLTFANHAASAAQSAFNLGVRPEDRWLAAVPLFHVGGLAAVFRSALQGSTLVLHGRFDADRVSEALDAERVTGLSVVPVMLRRLLDARGARPFPGHVRAVLLGGDACPTDLLAAARARGLPVLPTYGLTEACSQVSTASPHDTMLPVGASGRPLALTEVAVLDAGGAPVPPDVEGEIAIRGPVVTEGYHGDPAATATRRTRDGWWRTGDLGLLDKDGHLHVTGRAEDRIVTGGENVDPAVVEAALRGHPDVAEACVVGLPDPAWGQRVVAAVVPREGEALDAAALEAHCRRVLAGYQVPRGFFAVGALPRTASGKMARAAMRARLAQEPPERRRGIA